MLRFEMYSNLSGYIFRDGAAVKLVVPSAIMLVVHCAINRVGSVYIMYKLRPMLQSVESPYLAILAPCHSTPLYRFAIFTLHTPKDL